VPRSGIVDLARRRGLLCGGVGDELFESGLRGDVDDADDLVAVDVEGDHRRYGLHLQQHGGVPAVVDVAGGKSDP
jgi:hypothetical protein